MVGKKLLHNPGLTFLILGFVLVISIFWYQSAVRAYDVVIDGRVAAQVKDKQAFLQALQERKDYLAEQLGYEVTELEKIELRESKVDPELLEENVQKLVLQEVELGTEGYRFVVDGEPLFAMRDKDKLESLLEEYKQQYLKHIDKSAKIKSIEFKQDVEIKKTLVKPAEFVDVEAAKEIVYAKEQEATVIEVNEGDNLWLIARRYDMTVDELERLNPDIDPERIYPGDKLVISPFNPKLDVVIRMENTIIEPIPFETKYQKDNDLYLRQKITVKPGVPGKKRVTYDIALVNGLEASINIVNEEVLEEPVTRIVKVGTKRTVSRGGSRNYGVVQGTRVSSSYGWRTHPITGRRSFHDGIDIAARYGTGVYAYAEGKVTFAGWNGGYGKVIFIDHGNGLQTRYAHLSKIYVSVGERVDTGEKIGAVGSTGRSTGPHLHFEVRQNGSTRNPWNYL